MYNSSTKYEQHRHNDTILLRSSLAHRDGGEAKDRVKEEMAPAKKGTWDDSLLVEQRQPAAGLGLAFFSCGHAQRGDGLPRTP